FGLVEQTRTDVVRVIWPNGALRAEFDVKADQDVETEQRLKGSCPFLFAFDGKQMAFVKDAVPWGSAIGLRINTLGSAKIAATEEWYKIGRDQLVPHDGYYDLRFTAELWEVYYYDHLSLLTVDHPPGTEIFVDERFVIPPAKLAITTVEAPHKIARAVDDDGHDVTDIVATLDGRSEPTTTGVLAGPERAPLKIWGACVPWQRARARTAGGTCARSLWRWAGGRPPSRRPRAEHSSTTSPPASTRRWHSSQHEAPY